MTSAPPPEIPQWRRRLQEHKLQAVSWIKDRSRALGWGGIVAGGLCATIAVWPLAVTAWDFLGLTDWQAWRLLLFGVGALILAAGVVGTNWKRTSPIRLMWLILVAWLVAVVAVSSLTGVAWLLLDAPEWKPPKNLTARHLEAITTRAFAIVAGLGGVALLVLAYRRQRTTEAGDQREATKLFNERFTTAYAELGSGHAAVRLGAVHALAHLADDAPSEEEVQMVIDVLCAYLRMPYTPTSETLPKNASKARREEHRERELEFASFREVRHTIIRIIGNHLREPTRWRGKNFDFTGVVFDGGNLSRSQFTGGQVSFNGAQFTGGIVNFSEAQFTGGQVSFIRAQFTGGFVNFIGAQFTGGEVNFAMAQCTAGEMNFAGARFSDGLVSFGGAQFTGGFVDFDRAQFTGGIVNFYETKFASKDVSFISAKFTAGNVNFARASGACLVKLLGAIGYGEPGVITFPDHWRPSPKKDGEQPDAGDFG